MHSYQFSPIPFIYPRLGFSRHRHVALLDLSIRSFTAMEKEMAIYDALQLQPHRNFTQRLGPGSTDYLFIERLDPLQKVWSVASREDRHRWALDLLDATSWLEKLGFIHGDLAVRNLGVDSVNTLKIFDFGSSSPSESSTDVITDHFDLATCLHFILSGVDPFAGVQSRSEAIQIRDTLQAGRWTIAQGAEVIGGVIQDGWTGRAGAKSFKDLLNQVTRILGVPSVPLDLKARREYYQRLQLRCQDWLCNTPKNPLWKKPDEYIASPINSTLFKLLSTLIIAYYNYTMLSYGSLA
ncbi:kinase domain containing protein [Metarhizium acridum CQMa 102]|uniref:Kinase domain containing protein n=1 Tax=Metarhizium acridum (strain CQMa 102) TaxID=655827 RepID=E9DQZ6_METAQ|nr:kinase domain containing protein [Metarhizium acridum CQMa 102]EFY93674.1 kinase domain containing protein [Metarhizium acridum CQMa 102]